MKRKMDIETALRWAVRDELPKAKFVNVGEVAAIASSWGAIDSYAELLTKIDSNRYGVVPDILALTPPHPDAIRLGEAVRALDGLALGVPEGWNPIAEFGGLGGLAAAAVAKALEAETIVDRAGERRFKQRPSMLIIHHAVFGGVPDWRCEAPEAKPICENGKSKWFRIVQVWASGDHGKAEFGHWRDVEVDGFNARSRRPYPQAYRKYQLEPDPHLAIVGRINYEIWRSALDLLVDELASGLDEIELTPSPRPLRAWESDYSEPRIWRPLDDKPARPLERRIVVAGSRKPAKRASRGTPSYPPCVATVA